MRVGAFTLAQCRRKSILIAAGIITFLFLVLVSFSHPARSLPWLPPAFHRGDDLPYFTWDSRPFIEAPSARLGANGTEPNICDQFPSHAFDKVQVVLKTGAAEHAHRIHTSLNTVVSCIPNLLIFSDLADRIGPHEAIDVLADLPPSYASNKDFTIYEAQREAMKNGSQSEPNPEGWRLDRFKFLPMVEKATELRPSVSWYVFLEADTYISWDNILRFLENLNPSEPHYIGSPVPGGSNTWFAHGGSGVVLSVGAMNKFLARKTGRYGEYLEPPVSTRFEELAKGDCCGDAVLAYAMASKDIRISGYYPMFNGDNTEGMKINKDKWCNPIISLHHIGPEDMTALWKWEMGRVDRQKPLLYSDMFHYIHSNIKAVRHDWENWSTLPVARTRASSSAESCQRACIEDTECLQYSYNGKCRIDHVVRFGHPFKPDGEQFISGWDLDKIHELESERCDIVQWPKPSTDRRG